MIDLSAIDAIDVHVHAWAGGAAEEDPMLAQAVKYFGDVQPPKTLDDMASYYRERRMACVVFTVDGKNQTRAHVTNDEVLAFAPLAKDDVKEVARRMLSQLASDLMRARGNKLDVSDAAITKLCAEYEQIDLADDCQIGERVFIHGIIGNAGDPQRLVVGRNADAVRRLVVVIAAGVEFLRARPVGGAVPYKSVVTP